MEKIIEDFKKYYLQTPLPFEPSDGITDLFNRLEKKTVTPIYKRVYLFVGIVVLILFLFGGTILIGQNPVSMAVKNTAENLYNNLLEVTNLQVKTELEQPKRNAVPSPTPSSTPSTNNNPKVINSEPQGIEVSEQKKIQNLTPNDDMVKGVSQAVSKQPENREQSGQEKRDNNTGLQNRSENTPSEAGEQNRSRGENQSFERSSNGKTSGKKGN